MSRSAHLVAVLALALVGCSDRTVIDAAKSQVKAHVEPIPDVIDPYARPPGAATSIVVAMNHADPPADVKQPGSSNSTSPPEATRTSLGYEIRFASGSPVPTPTVHAGRLIVSGVTPFCSNKPTSTAASSACIWIVASGLPVSKKISARFPSSKQPNVAR